MRIRNCITMWLILVATLMSLSTCRAQTVSINCGGSAASPFVADTDYAGGTAVSVTNAITTSQLTGTVPPQAVLQSNRYGAFTYTVPGFTAGASCTVALYFAEEYWTVAGKRVFDLSINGTQVLTNFDIYATAGGEYIAIQKSFTETANSSGDIVITTTNVTDNAQINGIVVTAGASAPAAPTGLTASAGNAQVSLNWTASTGATSYNVYRGTSSGGESTTPIATGLTGTSYTNTTLTNGTTYYYTVAAVNASGTSAQSTQASATPEPSTPAAPTALTAAGGNAQVALSWTASTGATSYNVYRGTTSGGESTTALATGVAGTTYTDTSVANGTTYYYKVAAVNAGGTSALSNEASATPTSGTTGSGGISINCGGAAASSFVADVDYTGGTATSTASSIAMSQLTGTIPPQSVLQTNRYGAFTYTVPGFTAGVSCTVTLYFAEEYWTAAGKRVFDLSINGTQVLTNFDIYATAGGGNIAIEKSFTATANSSGDVVITTTNVTDNAQINGLVVGSGSSGGSAPSTPTGLAATGGNAQVALSWTASTGATLYNVYRSTTSGGEGTTVYATSTTASYMDTPATNGTTYYYTVAAANASGTSAQSTQASATPEPSTPGAPTGLAATGGNAQVALSWTASTGATSYNVYRGTTSGGESTTALATGLTGTTYTDTTVTNGTTYYYKVAAVNAGGTSALSNEASATPTSGTTGSGGISINCGGGAASPFVTDVDFTGGTEASVTNTITTSQLTGTIPPQAVLQSNRYGAFTYTIPGLTAGASYPVTLYFAEEYWTAAGKRLFDLSINGTQVLTNFDIYATAGGEFIAIEKSFTATANSSGDIVITTTNITDNAQINGLVIGSGSSGGSAPPVPTGLAATGGNAQVSLTWTASTGATSYNIYRSTTSGGEGTTAYATSTTVSYTDTAATNGTTYYYTVAAVNASGTSAQSTQASATPNPTAPAAPTALTATGGNAQVALSWTASTGATSYNVYRGTTSGGESTTAMVSGVTTTTYTDTTVTNGTTYYYKVAAANAGGTSGLSNEASAKPEPSAPGAPTGLTASGGNAQVGLTWTASTGAASYNVYRGTVSGGESTTPIATGLTGTAYTDTSVVNGDTYYYTVAAVNAGGASAASNEASATPEVLVSSGYAPSGYTLAWNDEFNEGVGAQPNSAYWNIDTGIGPNNDGWGNWEQQVDVNDQTHCHIISDPQATDGQALQIQATNDENWTTYGYHSAQIETLGKVQPEYGYIEMRAKLPSTQGMWPSFWMLGTDDSTIGWPNCGEMDIMEMFGQNPTTEFSSYHMGLSTDSEISWTQTYTSSTYQSNYHVYGLLWTPTSVTNYIDGNEFETEPSSTLGWVFNQPFYMILDLAVGGIPPGDVSQTSTVFPQNLDVDYIRVYEPGNGGPAGLYANPGHSQVSLTWTPSVGPATYDVYRGTMSGGESTTPIATGVSAAAYVDATAAAGVTYYYTVASVSALGTSLPSAEVSATPSVAPNFGPNVYIFTPSMNQTAVQNQINSVYNEQMANEFGTARAALLFAPGTYNLTVPVGFYTQVSGLGSLPGTTQINGYVGTNAEWNYTNATDNFWRDVENMTINPSASSGTDEYAVSQACPMRRVHVTGNLLLADEYWTFINGTAPGYASGGFLADSQIDDEVESISQQQWFTRNSSFASWSNGVWNMVFVGDAGAPATSWPTASGTSVQPYTTVANTPTIREKPFLTVDGSGNYDVFVPSLRSNVQGTSWSSGSEAGTSIPISQFYIAQAGTDNAATINAALNQGLSILFTPGVYALNGTIDVNNANTVLLGLGLATLQANTGQSAIQVADVDGVSVSGLLIESASNVTGALMQVGPAGSSANHSANPILLADLFFRIGGAVAGQVGQTLVINSNNVIGDDFWLWRADHGLAGTVGWAVNTATNGLIVNGQNCTVYGLAVEHFQQYQTQWNANGGSTYFYQSEEPYDVPAQSNWMNGALDGYASYEVANTVTSHQAYGLGIYCYFDVNPSGVSLSEAIQAPDIAGVNFTDMLTDSLGGVGTIDSIINGQGGAVTNNGGTANENSYLANYP